MPPFCDNHQCYHHFDHHSGRTYCEQCKSEGEKAPKSIYLGDGVYASYANSWRLTVYLHDGYAPKNEIVLDPDVLSNLISFATQMGHIQP